MAYLLSRGLTRDDVRDLYPRQVLAVAALPVRVLPPLLLEGDDLRGPRLGDDLAHDGSARDRRRADLRARHQDLAEGDGRTRVAGQALDVEHITLSHPVLLSARADDREHRCDPEINSKCLEKLDTPGGKGGHYSHEPSSVNHSCKRVGRGVRPAHVI